MSRGKGRRLTVQELAERLPTPEGMRFVVGLERGELSIELYRPQGHDPQQPHTRDEAYVVVEGRGEFVMGDERVPFGPGASPAAPPYRLARRGARQPVTPGPGLSGETVLQDPSGLAMHELTAAAGASGRRPFETKQPELVLVLEGALELQLGQETKTLQQGDAILVPSQPVTGWRNPARDPARVLWVVLDA